MIFKQSSVGVLTVLVVALFLLLSCLPVHTVCADGAGGQWPLDPPANPTSGGDDDGGGDGSSTDTTLLTLAATLGFLL